MDELGDPGVEVAAAGPTPLLVVAPAEPTWTLGPPLATRSLTGRLWSHVRPWGPVAETNEPPFDLGSACFLPCVVVPTADKLGLAGPVAAFDRTRRQSDLLFHVDRGDPLVEAALPVG